MLSAMASSSGVRAFLAAVLLFCIAATATNASLVSDSVSKQFVHGSANQTYIEALIIVNNRERNGRSWTLLGSAVEGASVLTQFPRSFGVGGVVCHIGPTSGNQPSSRWNAAFKFLTSSNGELSLKLDYDNDRPAPIHISVNDRFNNSRDTISEYNAAGGKGVLYSWDYVAY